MNPPSSGTRDAPAAELPLWRYMNFAKFVSLLDSRGLFFSYAREFSDLFEGRAEGRRVPSGSVAVSSWHCSAHESEAMWRLYSPIEEAVALQTTYARLRAALPEDIRIDRVQYVEAPERLRSKDPLGAYFYKRKEYEHEKEWRAVVRPGGVRAGGARETADGWWFSIDVDDLLQAVYVSPFSADWFHAVVSGVRGQYGHRFPVVRSALTGAV